MVCNLVNGVRSRRYCHRNALAGEVGAHGAGVPVGCAARTRVPVSPLDDGYRRRTATAAVIGEAHRAADVLSQRPTLAR